MRTSHPGLQRIVKDLKVRNADIRIRKERYAERLVKSIPKHKVVLR